MFLFPQKNYFAKNVLSAALGLFFLTSLLFISCNNPTTGSIGDFNGQTSARSAQNPIIRVQPLGGSWDIDTQAAFDLTVTASSLDGGTLTYQWYRNPNNSSSGGIKISSATGDKLSLADGKYPTNGDYYFYVTITNTIADNGDGGVKTKTTTSDAAKVTVTNGDNYTDITMPEDLKGAWVSIWNEEYTITETTFTSGYEGDVTYEGDIVNIRGKNGSNDAGYITIKYTTVTYDPAAVGKYYVIRYENLTSSTMSISGAANMNDPGFEGGGSGGKATDVEAETAYILENEYFGMGSTVTKQEGGELNPPVPELLKTNWSDGGGSFENSFNITGTTLTYSMVGFPFFQAKIVKVNALDEESGYLVFQYISNSLDDELDGTYCVLYYNGLTADGANLAIFNDGADGTFGDAGEVDQDNAEILYVITNSDYYDPDYDLITCTD